MGLLAEGWKALVGIPADLATDRVIPARSVLSSSTADRLTAVGAAATLDEGVARLRTLVLEAMADAMAADPRIQAVDAWLQRPGRPVVDDLLESLGLSLRHVERLVRRTHGLAPRLLERKFRTLRVAHALAIDVEARPYDESFYDQSHLIQNFRRFVGTTPSRFREEDRVLARLLLNERWKAGARHRLALWG